MVHTFSDKNFQYCTVDHFKQLLSNKNTKPCTTNWTFVKTNVVQTEKQLEFKEEPEFRLPSIKDLLNGNWQMMVHLEIWKNCGWRFLCKKKREIKLWNCFIKFFSMGLAQKKYLEVYTFGPIGEKRYSRLLRTQVPYLEIGVVISRISTFMLEKDSNFFSIIFWSKTW